MGLLWLAAAISFVVASIAVFALAQWWQALTLVITFFSLAVTVLGLPSSTFGVLINFALLVYLFIGEKMDWLPHLA